MNIIHGCQSTIFGCIQFKLNKHRRRNKAQREEDSFKNYNTKLVLNYTTYNSCCQNSQKYTYNTLSDTKLSYLLLCD